MAFIATSSIQIRTPSQTMKLVNQKSKRGASPTPSISSSIAKDGNRNILFQDPSSDPELCPASGASSPVPSGHASTMSASPGRKRTGLKKLKNNIRSRVSLGKSSRKGLVAAAGAGGGGGGSGGAGAGGESTVVSGEATDPGSEISDFGDRVSVKRGQSSTTTATISTQPPLPSPTVGGTLPRPTSHKQQLLPPELPPSNDVNAVVRERTGDTDARETIDGSSRVPSNGMSIRTHSYLKSRSMLSENNKDHGRTSPIKETLSQSTKSTSRSTSASQQGEAHPMTTAPTVTASMSMPSVSNNPPPPFQFISDDNFTRRVNTYDGQVITCSDSKMPTYEVGNYLGGGVAGVVYEGKRLRPVHEYPPLRMQGDGAFYPNVNGGETGGTGTGTGGGIVARGPSSPVAMTMTGSSLSGSIQRNRSTRLANIEPVETGTGLFADVYRAVTPHKQQGSVTNNVGILPNGQRLTPAQAAARGISPRNLSRGGVQRGDDAGGCTSFLFGNCGFGGQVDDRAVPLAATPMVQAGIRDQGDQRSGGGGTTGKERYQAVDMASIEVPAAFSSLEQETPTGGEGAGSGFGAHHVVVDDADAPNRSKREARALSRKDGITEGQPRLADINDGKRGHSFLYDSEDDMTNPAGGGGNNNNAHLIEDMSETVAIKILNPVGFRLLDPEMLHKAVIVREGRLPDVRPDGSYTLGEEHVWWLVNPNSRNLRSLLRKNHLHHSSGVSHGSSLHTSKGDDASEESSLKRQGSVTQSLVGGVDRGSPERGLRLSLVATFVDPKTNTLRELPLPRCVEIWGHPPFSATDEEFEAMMEALLRLNAGGSSGLQRKQSMSRSRSSRGAGGRSPSNLPQVNENANNNDPLASRRAGSTVFCPALSAHIAVPAIPPKYLRWLKQRRLATKEVRNMMRIGRHKNVVHLYEVLEMVQDSKSTMFLILELVRGGELFDLISSNSSSKRKKESAISANELHEVTMRKFFWELASGINFIHSCGVAHRDLKPENLLIHTKPLAKDGSQVLDATAEEERTLKIADFGLSAAFQLHPSPNNTDISRGGSGNSQWDGNSVWEGRPNRQSSGLPMSPQSERVTPGKSGISPLLNRVGATALSMLTCGSMTNVCIDDGMDNSDLVDDGFGSTVDLRRMTSVVGSPHYVAPEIIAQADKGKQEQSKEGGAEAQDRKSRHAQRSGYDGTKADVWSAGVILYAMLFRSLPFGEDLLRCPRYQAFQKWYNDARQLQPPLNTHKRNRRAFPEVALDPDYDEFDEEEMLGPHWFFPSEISAPGRDLIVAMLNPNPNDRLTIEMVLQHPWLAVLNTVSLNDRMESMPRMSGLCISGT